MGVIAEKEKQEERIIGRVLANTLAQKRPSNLIEIANDIEFLKNKMGSLESVSRVVGISSDMLRQFLCVNQLSPEVRKLVKDRKIDSVTIIHKMRRFNENEQKIISDEVISGRLTSGDVRALAALKNKLPELTIHELISRLLSSKDIRLYVVRFQIPQELKEMRALKESFEGIVGKDQIISFDVEEGIGSLELTKVGLKKLREAAKQRNLTLRKFVELIVSD